jgi:thioredoxin-like negative regulator of GroEL
VLAKIYAESPYLLLGSTSKANQHFKSVLKIAPKFPANKILYAEFFLNLGDLPQARSLLIKVENEHSLKKFPLYEYIWKLKISQLMGKIENHESFE